MAATHRLVRLRLAEGSELARHVLVMGARLAKGGGFARRFMPSVLKRRLRNAELQTSNAQPDEVRLQIYKTLISACWLADQKHLMLLILRSLNIADEMGTAESIAGAYAVMGFTLDHVGWSRLAKRYSDKALSFADRTSSAATVGLVYYFRSEHNFFKANWTEAEQAFLKAREASDGAGDLLFWASASKMLCEMWSETGDFTRVLAFAGEMIDLGRDAAFQPALRWGFSARGKAMRRLGQRQQARSDLEESLRLGIVSRDCIDIACAAGELALCILVQDGPDAAEELLERIQHELSSIRILPHTIWAIYLAAAEISLKRLEAEPFANGDVYRKAQLSCAKASQWARRYPFARAGRVTT